MENNQLKKLKVLSYWNLNTSLSTSISQEQPLLKVLSYWNLNGESLEFRLEYDSLKVLSYWNLNGAS